MTAKKNTAREGYATVDEISAVLTRLQVLPGREASIKECANALGATFGLSAPSDQLRFQRRGTRIALRELRKAAHHCCYFARYLDEMPAEAQSALSKEMGSKQLYALQRGIGPVLKKINQAVWTMEDGPVTPGPKGRVRKRVAAEVTRQAAQIYTYLTGKRPTLPSRDGKAYGPYQAFLEDLFEVLGVDASPENQGKRSGNPPQAAKEKKDS